MASTRRLAVVMFTDTVGYTGSVQADEAGALRRLREQEELVRPVLVKYQGREIKSTGDGFLVEFGSALEATQCAVEIQRRLHERNSRPETVPVELRIGIHLGDVERHDGDIFGDAVNIAARVVPLAEPGGICISEQVFDQVRNKIPNPLEKLPPQSLKGVHYPVDMYRVALPWRGGRSEPRGPGPVRLAVLPFTNISPDHTDEYFADGLTEELITFLSQLGELRVIARTSVMPYKSTPKTVAQVGAELGVVSVLEGSVRRAGDRIRITVQLIDVRSEEHSWSETFDRKLEDVFAIQTEVAERIADVLKIRMAGASGSQIEGRAKVRPDAYDAYLKGLALLHFRDKQSLLKARDEFERAISLDAKNPRAYCALAETLIHLDTYHLEGANALKKAQYYLAKALELDPDLPEVHALRGCVIARDYQFDAAEAELRKALDLNPSLGNARRWYANLLEDTGRPDAALEELSLAEEADPLSAATLFSQVQLLVWLGRTERAASRLERLASVERKGPLYHDAARLLAEAEGEVDRAVQELEWLRESDPSPENQVVCRVVRAIYLHERDQCLTLVEEMKKVLPPEPLNFLLAYVYSQLDDLDGAFGWLAKSLKTKGSALRWWRLDPHYAKMRADPRFDELLRGAQMSGSGPSRS